MFHETIEHLVQFASQGDLEKELGQARKDYVARTGQLFETDADYEHRLNEFLEWYVLDRPVNGSALTPAQLFLDRAGGPQLSDVETIRIRRLAVSKISIFEFRKSKPERIEMTDLVSGERHDVYERRTLIGLEPGDLLHARLVEVGDRLHFTGTWTVLPRNARKVIIKSVKRLRDKWRAGDFEVGLTDRAARIAIVHRIVFLTNKANRYKHVDPLTIFSELTA